MSGSPARTRALEYTVTPTAEPSHRPTAVVTVPPRRKTLEAKTICHKAAPKLPASKALRVAVPALVVNFFDIRPGDALKWTVDPVTGKLEVEAIRPGVDPSKTNSRDGP